MAQRLSSLDAAFLSMENATTPMHVGGLAVFRCPGGALDLERVRARVAQRLAAVPSHRRRVQPAAGGWRRAEWVDDPDFDADRHVRRVRLTPPGDDTTLRVFVAGVMREPLDRRHPLWEVLVVDGLDHDRFALVTKTHHAMVDGLGAVDFASRMLDVASGEPVDSMRSSRRRDRDTARASERLAAGPAGTGELLSLVAENAGGLRSLAGALRRPPSPSVFRGRLGPRRRFATAATRLDDYRRARTGTGGTVNDVALAVVAGALRSWLTGRGQRVPAHATLRTLVPVSLRGAASAAPSGNRVAGMLVDLPLGCPDPAERLRQTVAATSAAKRSGQATGVDALLRLSRLSPASASAVAARAINAMAGDVLDAVVSSVPGPQQPLYAAGAPLLAAYPVVPLAHGLTASIGLTSYNGAMYYGLHADADAVPDLDELAAAIPVALAELVAASAKAVPA